MAVDTIDRGAAAPARYRWPCVLGLPVVAILPFGLFGALAVDNGFTIFEAMMKPPSMAAPARWSASSCSARRSRPG